jgi:hypothetical protein
VDLLAGDSVTVAGPVQLGGGINDGGGEAPGGELYVSAGCGGATLSSTVDLTGGMDGGGALIVESDGDLTFSGSVDARARKLGGFGGYVVLEAGARLEVTPSAIINVDGHSTSNPDEQGEGGVVFLAGCEVEVDGSTSTGAVVTARGAWGGGVAVEASREELGPTEHSLRVATGARIETTGTDGNGPIYVAVAERRRGVCSNNVLVECDLKSECVFGCNAGSCQYPNPNTDGTATQFVPAAIVEQSDHLLRCGEFCP